MPRTVEAAGIGQAACIPTALELDAMVETPPDVVRANRAVDTDELGVGPGEAVILAVRGLLGSLGFVRVHQALNDWFQVMIVWGTKSTHTSLT